MVESRVAAATLEEDGRILSVSFGSGQMRRFHAIWLRDNAQDPETRDPGNGQRLIRVGDLPENPVIAAAALDDKGGLELAFGPDGHKTRFEAGWLAENAYDGIEPAPLTPEDRITWDAALSNRLVAHDFNAIESDDPARLAYLEDLYTLGVALVSDAPHDSGTVLRIAEVSGPVRETNYGRLFDVRSSPNPVNLAYSGLGLQAHTDNPYRDPVPTVQVLHCLQNTVDGGDTSLVDGFAAAERLQRENRPAFDLLARYPARFRYDGDGVSDLQARRPMIELGPDGQLLGIRFNNRSAAPLADVPFEKMEAYYAAWRSFAGIIDDPAMALNFRLEPGMAFSVDNRRVLHSRTAFSSTGSRWLQGCYADMDAVGSRRRVLARQLNRQSPR